MSERSWTRRDFGRAVAPTLVAGPLLATLAGPAGAGGTELGGSGSDALPELWPEARATLDFYRKHLPSGFQLGRPTVVVRDQAVTSTRSVVFRVLDGGNEVGHLELDATFRSDRSALLWQGTQVTGPWYGASITNAYKAGEFA